MSLRVVSAIGLAMVLSSPPEVIPPYVGCRADAMEISNPRDVAVAIAAIERRDLSTLNHLLQNGMDPNSVTQHGESLLRVAMYSDFPGAARLLLQFGAEVDGATPDGWTPLMGAAALLSDAMVRVLLEAGADPLRRNASGANAIEIAMEQLRRRVQVQVPFTRKYLIVTLPALRRHHPVIDSLRRRPAPCSVP